MVQKVLVTAQMPTQWHESLVEAGFDVILGEGGLDHDGLVAAAPAAHGHRHGQLGRRGRGGWRKGGGGGG